MFIEALFSILFFVLPIAGMFITILTTKLEEKEHKEIKRQPVVWHMPKMSVKTEDKHSNHFFERKRELDVSYPWLLDTS
ncbi:MAG: hypothetical protein K0S71_1872 [Clostridia bacterium]|jgi:hypothetical protein|nr:hypothetical protein [Clostridia bacterium]